MTIPSSVKTMQASDWPEYVKTLKDYRPFLTTFDGTYFDVILKDGSHQLIIVTDLNGFADVRGNKSGTQTLINGYNTLQAIQAGDTLLGVRVGTTVTVAGAITANQGSAGAAAWPVTGPAGGLNVNPYNTAFDGANNAYAQTAVAAAAVQLVSSGVLYKELHIKSIGTLAVWIGWDNAVTTTTGYELEKLGVDDEKVFYSFNANLWGISTGAGGNISLIARG